MFFDISSQSSLLVENDIPTRLVRTDIIFSPPHLSCVGEFTPIPRLGCMPRRLFECKQAYKQAYEHLLQVSLTMMKWS